MSVRETILGLEEIHTDWLSPKDIGKLIDKTPSKFNGSLNYMVSRGDLECKEAPIKCGNGKGKLYKVPTTTAKQLLSTPWTSLALLNEIEEMNGIC